MEQVSYVAPYDHEGRMYAVGSFCIAMPRFCLRQHGTCHLFACGFSARSAEKPHAIEKECTALPKAQYAICVSPRSIAILPQFQCCFYHCEGASPEYTYVLLCKDSAAA